MESKKRQLLDSESSQSVAKKRIIADANGTPRVNGTSTPIDDSEDDINAANVETFRKQAIYRRMKHYSRENERSREEILRLVERNRSSEAGLRALVACWAQLINTIRSLTTSNTAENGVNPPVLYDILSRTREEEENQFEVENTLQDSVTATKALVEKFAQPGSQKTVAEPHALHEYQKKCADLELEMQATRNELEEYQQRFYRRTEELESCQARCERLRTTSHRIQSPVLADSSGQNYDRKESEEPVTDVSPPNPQLPITGSDDLLARISGLEMDIKGVKGEREAANAKSTVYIKKYETLEKKWASPTIDLLLETSAVKELQGACSIHEQHAKDLKTQNLELQNELSRIKAEFEQFRNEAKDLSKDAEIEKQFSKANSDATRYKQERDLARADLAELKAKETELGSIYQLQTLVTTQSERIRCLDGEVRRHKLRLAANAGDSDLVDYFFSDKDTSRLILELKERAASAEAKTTASISDSSDLTQLQSQIKQRDKEIERLKLIESRLTEDTSSIDAELVSLSTAWETLEQQVKDKVFNLSNVEERIQKLQSERTKLESKCASFAQEKESAIRDRMSALKEKQNAEALATTRKKQIDECNKLKKQLEEELQDYKAKIIDQDHERAMQANHQRTLTTRIREYEDALAAEHAREKEYVIRDGEYRKNWFALEKEKAGLQSWKERLDKEKQNLSLKSASPTVKVAELEKQVAHMNSWAHCSVCKEHYRTMIIKNCGHSFCKRCVEERISSRQRKCMNCSTPFGKDDVLHIF